LKRLSLLLAVAALAQCKRRVPEPAPPLATGSLSGPSRPAASTAVFVRPSGEDLLASDAGSEVLHFAVIGDYGADTPAEAAVATMVKRWQPHFVITLGDNNYPSGEASTIDRNIGQFYAEFIGNYRGRFGPGSPKNRFWPSVGNHDWIAGLAAYLEYFTLPGNERYYDVDLGLVHLYALDSDIHEPDGISPESQQAAWLKQRLAASKACHDVVFFHHPAYSTADHGPTLAMRWPFRKWGADVVFAGHDHTYERFEVDGIPYFVNGLGGASRYEFPAAPTPETRYRYNEDFGAMRVVATPAQIVYEFFTIDGKRRDAFTMPASCRP
jgi:tartrate-resistant acid phosphatase type 5